MDEIWHLINDPNPRRGGAQRVLKEAAFQSDKIFSQKDGQNRSYKKFLKNYAWVLFLVIEIVKRRPQIVFIHSRCFLPLSPILRFLKAKTVFYTHANYQKWNWLFRLFRCDQYIAVSDTVKGLLTSNGVPEKIIAVIKNPYIAGSKIPPKPSQAQKINLACIGSLNPWKGIALAATSLSQISSSQGIPISLTIIGEGPERDVISNLPGNSEAFTVKLLGYREFPYEDISDIPIIIIPSLEEGFGLVAIESVYQGKIVIYNRIPALSEVCNDQDLCFPFSHDDPESLVKALKIASNQSTLIFDQDRMKKRSADVLKEYGKEIFLERHKKLRSSLTTS
ncbi:UDP-D-galactose:(glucosyl)lipopolysaccharide-1,6-D-galactosyltransferase [compost metagenome]